MLTEDAKKLQKLETEKAVIKEEIKEEVITEVKEVIEEVKEEVKPKRGRPKKV